MARSPHVCIVSCQHIPDDVRVTHKVGMSMRQAGFRVTWVGPRRPRAGDDYGIDFRYYRLSHGRVGRLRHRGRAMKLAGAVDDVDVYYAVEMDSAAAAVRLARRNKARAIFDIHEIYHAEGLSAMFTGLAFKLASPCVLWGMLRVCRRSDLVVAVSESVLAPYLDVATPKIIVRNCAPAAFADGPPSDVLSADRQAVTLMHGKGGPASRGTQLNLKAAALAARQLDRPVRVIVFSGYTEKGGLTEAQLRQMADEVDAGECLDVRAPVPFNRMPDVLRECDIGMLMYDRYFGVRGLPNRLFEFMARGLPVIGPEYGTEVRRIVEPERCGVLTDCEDPDAVAEAIVRMVRNADETRRMGQRGREAFLQRHNWQVEIELLIERIHTWCQA